MKPTVFELLFVAILAVITLGVVAMALQADKPVVSSESRPYLCLVPYHPDYCKAHQAQMYREQAMRAR